MSKQTVNFNFPGNLINVGRVANDRSGDPLRTAFDKLNDAVDKIDANFTELYNATGAGGSYHLGDDTQFIDIDPASGIIVIQSGFDTSMPVYIKGANCSDGGVGGNVIIEAGGPGLPNDGTTGNIELAAQQTTIESNNNMWTFRDDGVLELPVGGYIVDSDGNNILDGISAGLSIADFGEGFSLDNSDKIVTNKLYSTNETQPNQHYRLELDTNGVVHLPDQSIINGATLKSVAGNYAGITAGPVGKDEDSWMWVDSDGAWIATDYSDNAYTWQFTNDGKLKLPNNGTIVNVDGYNILDGYLTNETYRGTIDKTFNIISTYPIVSVDTGTNSFVVTGNAVGDTFTYQINVDTQSMDWTLIKVQPSTHLNGETTIYLDDQEDIVDPDWVGHDLRCVTRNYQPNYISFDTSFSVDEDNTISLNAINSLVSTNTNYNLTVNNYGIETNSPIKWMEGTTEQVILNYSPEDNRFVIATGYGSTPRYWYFGDNGSLTFPDATVQSTAFQDVPSHIFFVHPNTGRTFTATGTYTSPFATISAANAAAVTAGHSDSNPAVIVLMANTTENVTLVPGVYLTSLGTGTHGSPTITGTVTVTSSSGTTVSNHYSISNLRIVAPTNGHCINFTGTYPQKLFIRDMWLDANGTGDCLYMDNVSSVSTVQFDIGHLAHSGSGDVYCINVVHGGCYVTDIETTGACQVAAVQTGAVLTITGSELDANGDVVCETYGTGSLTITLSIISNAKNNANGIQINDAGGTVTLGNNVISLTGTGGFAVQSPAGGVVYHAGNVFTGNNKRSSALGAGFVALPTTWTSA